MKKITNNLKTMTFAIIVLVMAQGCIPTVPISPSGGTANPNIIHKTYNYFYDIKPDGSAGKPYAYEMDLDNDGSKDIKFEYQASGAPGAVYLLALPNKDIVFATESINAISSYDTKSYAINTPILQDTIGWNNKSTIEATYLLPFTIQSANTDGTCIIGIRAKDANNNFYYAWLRIKYNVTLLPTIGVNTSIGNIQIIESGVHKIANANIKAGEY